MPCGHPLILACNYSKLHWASYFCLRIWDQYHLIDHIHVVNTSVVGVGHQRTMASVLYRYIHDWNNKGTTHTKFENKHNYMDKIYSKSGIAR